MRTVAIVSMFGFKELNGSNLRLYYLSRELVSQGYRLHFIVPSEKDAKSIHARFDAPENADIHTHFSGMMREYGISSGRRFMNYFLMKFALSRILDGIDADLVYCEHIPSGEVALSSGNKAVKVLDVFDVWSEYLKVSRNPFVTGLVMPYLKWRENKVFNGVDRIITCTSQTGKVISGKYGISSEKLSIIHDGVDTGLFTPLEKDIDLRRSLGADPEDFVITFHGGMKKHDGLFLLVEAAQKLKGKIPVKFLLIGEGNECEALKTYARKLGVTDEVIFTGKVPHEDIPAYLSVSDAGIIARLTWQGDIPASLMECMACSVPVISSALDGIETYFTDGKDIVLFDLNDPGSLAGKITEIYSDRSLYDEIKQNSRASILGFDRKKSAENIFGFLKKTMKENKR